MRIVMAAGGTAGHIEPALSVADAIRRSHPDVEVVFMGSERGLEGSLVPSRGYRLITVRAVPMPRKPSLAALRFPSDLAGSIREARRHLRDLAPSAVVGFGGYAALPAYVAARRLGIPLIVHEGNARAGIANRVAARLGATMLAAVPGTVPGAAAVGMPLRPSISGLDRSAQRAEALAEFGLDPAAPVLLVFGGSQGARRLNAALGSALSELLEAGIQVLHIYGSANEPVSTRAGYVGVPYTARMDLAYSAADLAVGRAGAMTCAELAACGLPAILVPLAVGNGEQRLNARPLERAGGAILIDDDQVDGDRLAREVGALAHDPARLRSMSEASRAIGVRDADETMSRIVMTAACGGSQ